MARREYELTDAEYAELIEACRPVPMVALQCGAPSSPQERANLAWAALGAKLGFRVMTVRGSEKGDRFFTAEEVDRA